ncbi:hypothetical protein M9H77_36810 [Catharanthus roseus]|uniref:Uncharacterized protein n=1 Tax=Catharanthus roseus TaxID=4058 RepID=A0ACB9ZTR8_CATRO|nr:hypothetical protein M9H77_36810 [Catharanthus roseus]
MSSLAHRESPCYGSPPRRQWRPDSDGTRDGDDDETTAPLLLLLTVAPAALPAFLFKLQLFFKFEENVRLFYVISRIMLAATVVMFMFLKKFLAHIGFRLLIVLIGYLKILIKILSFDRSIYSVSDSFVIGMHLFYRRNSSKIFLSLSPPTFLSWFCHWTASLQLDLEGVAPSWLVAGVLHRQALLLSMIASRNQLVGGVMVSLCRGALQSIVEADVVILLSLLLWVHVVLCLADFLKLDLELMMKRR